MSAFATVPTLTGSAARDFWAVLVTGEKFQITGVKSISQEDVDGYPGDTYRDRVTAADLGSPQSVVLTNTDAQDSVYLRDNTFIGTDTKLDGAIVQTLQGNSGFAQDDSFAHVAPRKRQATKSLLRFWDATAASGNLIGMFWLHELRYLGPTEPEFLA